jgi:ribonuclease P protein component
VGERLFRDQRIRLSSEFAEFRSGSEFEFRSTFFTLKILDVGRNVSRLGVIVTKKVGNAIIRNKVRRVMREIFRKNLQKQSKNYDYLIIAKGTVVGVSYEKIKSEVLNAASIIYRQMSQSQSAK